MKGCSCDLTQLILYLIIVCTNSVYALASLFLPDVFKEKAIPGFWVGLVFAMYSIVVVLVSPIIGKIVGRVGFANLIAFGLVMMGISIIPTGYLSEIENDWLTLMASILLRALQGAASASINTSCFSLAANKYTDKTEFIVGMLEGMGGIGVIVGLMGGSIVYEALGRKAVFIVFGCLLLFMAVLSRICFGVLARVAERVDM